MNGRILHGVLAAGALAMTVGACGGDNVKPLDPDASWSYISAPDITVVVNDPRRFSVDFGDVALGEVAVLEIEVKNVGSIPLTVSPIANLDGFAVDFASVRTVNVAETWTIKLSFSPTEVKSYNSTTALSVADHPAQNLALSLKGAGHKPAFTCEPTKLDFGALLKGRTRTLSLNCRNNSEVGGVLIVSPISGENPALFGYRIDDDNGRPPLGPKESYQIDVWFMANGSGLATARFEILQEVYDDEPARVATVSLVGVTTNHAIECGPGNLDFGSVAPGHEKHLEITCLNGASEAFAITSIALDVPLERRFSWEPTVTPIVIPADSTGQTIDVAFSPIADDLGSHISANLILNTDDETNPQIVLPLTGFAGGPAISCVPARIDFGQVAKSSPLTRTVACSNTGVDDPDKTDDTLLIEAIGPTQPEFSVKVRDGLKHAGYEVNETFILEVTYSPVDDGPDSAFIRFSSNDTVHDPFDLPVAGRGLDLPPCVFDVVPPELHFGIVDKGDSASLEFAVRNKSTDVECLIRNLRLAPTCAAEFELPDVPVESVMLPTVDLDSPGSGELRFPIKFSPTAHRSTPFTCEVLFDISDQTGQPQSIKVSGASQEICLLVSPTNVDFGATVPGCSSRKRELRLTNICSPTIVLERIETGPGASEEFLIVAEPPPRTTLTAGAAVTVDIAYRPEAEGEDRGSLLFYVNRNGVMGEPYMATLSGRGDYNAVQTDSFKQQDRTKVDMLWVIDNSGSMADEQSKLALNLKPFIEQALTQEIDFNMAVTTTGLNGTEMLNGACPGGVDGVERGRFFPVNGYARGHPRIITRDTKDLAGVWAENVTVGTCQGGDEQVFLSALAALTPPLIDRLDDETTDWPNDANGGFLRPEALLSIIAVTDEYEHSQAPVSYYYDQFSQIKGYRNSHLFKFHAITGDKIFGCNYSGSGGEGAQPGDRLISMVEMAGGMFQSICAEDWGESLKAMSSIAFGIQNCFQLTSVPANPDEMVLKTNGLPIPTGPAGGEAVWFFDFAKNEVCFSAVSIPEPGAQLEVTYTVACGG